MGIIGTEENSQVGDKFKVILQPKISMIGTGVFNFSEDSIRGIIETFAAIYFEWEVSEITFPIIDGVKSVSLVMTRVQMFNQAGQALVVLISGLVGALAFAFILISVDKMSDKVAPGPALPLTVIGAFAVLVGGVIVYLKIR